MVLANKHRILLIIGETELSAMLTFCDPVLAMIRSCSQFIAARSDYLQLIEQGGGSRKRIVFEGRFGRCKYLADRVETLFPTVLAIARGNELMSEVEAVIRFVKTC